MPRARVLIVDDDPTLTELASARLSRDGFVVDALTSGFGLAARVRSFRPDVMVLDLQMPGLAGNGAVEVVRQMAARYGMQTPQLVLYSGLTRSVIEDASHQLAAAGWVSKDASLDELSAAVRRAVSVTGLDASSHPNQGRSECSSS
jgi:two-component system OmpR family response regulator